MQPSKLIALVLACIIVLVGLPAGPTGAEEAHTQAGTIFTQGAGYQQGAYDLNAPQPTHFNWNRQTGYTAPSSPKVAWSHSVDSWISSAPVIGADGTVYVGSEWGLHALTPDGQQKWHHSSNPVHAVVIAADGSLLIGGNYFLASVSPSGDRQWTVSLEGYRVSSPVIDKDGRVLIRTDRFLYCFSPSGTQVWRYASSINYYGPLLASPIIGTDGTIYLPSLGIDALTSNGKIKWDFPLPQEVYSTPLISDDGTIYFGARDDRFYALSPDGVKKWHVVTGGEIHGSPALGRDGTVYIGSRDGKLYGISPNGSVVWDKRHYQSDAPALVDSTGRILFNTGALAVLPAEKGELSFMALNWSNAYPYAIDTQGRLYVSTENRLICIENDTTVDEQCLVILQVHRPWVESHNYTSLPIEVEVSNAGGMLGKLEARLIPRHYTSQTTMYMYVDGQYANQHLTVRLRVLEGLDDFEEYWEGGFSFSPGTTVYNYFYAQLNTRPRTGTPYVDANPRAGTTTIRGGAEAGATVTLLRNHWQTLQTTADASGEFLFELTPPLTQGETLILTAEIAGKKKSYQQYVYVNEAIPETRIVVGQVYAAPGTVLVVPINMQGGIGVTGMQFRITFDPTVLRLQAGGLKALLPESTVLINDERAAEGEILVTMIRTYPMEIHGYPICELTMDAIGRVGQESAVEVSPLNGVLLKNERAEEVTAILEQGWVRVHVVYGDINDDGSVDVGDAVLILRNSVGIIPFDQRQMVAADVNGDLSINSADAILVLRKIVGYERRFPVEPE